MSDLFDPEARRKDEPQSGELETRRDAEAPPPTNDQPPPAEQPPPPEQPPPAEQPRAPDEQQPPPAEDAPWSPPEYSTWPYRSEPEPEPEPPPPPPPSGLNPLVRLGVPQPWRAIIDWIVTIAGAILIVFAIKSYVVNPYRIPSSSMEPTLHCARAGGSGCLGRFSDRVLANRFIYHFRDPRRGEIIVFHVPNIAEEKCGAGGVFVKRIIGLPGDVWQERQGFVYINRRKLNEPYIKKDRRDSESWPARRIPKNNYFMMGDNRQSSCDSRKWGTVPRSRVIGKVFAIYWPPQRIRIM